MSEQQNPEQQLNIELSEELILASLKAVSQRLEKIVWKINREPAT